MAQIVVQARSSAATWRSDAVCSALIPASSKRAGAGNRRDPTSSAMCGRVVQAVRGRPFREVIESVSGQTALSPTAEAPNSKR